jgi:catechol 2,3-dioxygenase
MSIDPRVDIGHVHLKVSDIDRAIAFYEGVLGFEVMLRARDEAAFLSAGGYHHHIGLNTWESKGAGPPPRNTTASTTRRFAIRIARRSPRRCAASSRPVFPSAVRAITASARRSTSRDPDDNGVELYRDRPQEE